MHHIQLKYLNSVHQSLLLVSMNFFPILVVGGYSVFDVVCHTSGHKFSIGANRNKCSL